MGDIVPVEIIAAASAGESDLVVVGCLEGEAPPLDGVPPALEATVRSLASRATWKGRDGQRLDGSVGADGPSVALVGLGKAAELDSRRLRKTLDGIAGAAGGNGVRRLAIVLPPHEATEGEPGAAPVLRALALAGYRFDRYRKEPSPDSRLERIGVVPPPGEDEAWSAAARVASAVAAGVSLARDLANTPPNEATPVWMAEQARELGAAQGLQVTVLDPAELERRGMGGILAVGRGSRNPPQLVRMETGSAGPVVALVGKGVTFDTGGISIKPGQSMEEMKYDKSGACSVLGIVHAVHALGLPVRLRAYLPLAENMPDGAAYRPGDIVRCYDGTTVEIHNTDAEGRMILADALAWAVEEKPDHVVEFSTLTGACVVALGHHGAGLFSPEDALAGGLLAAAERAGERLWRLPLWPEFAEEMKGVHGDLRNSGGRWGGAATAAAFLSHFVGEHRSWAHLDIAGPAYVGFEGKAKSGATGYGVALTVEWLRGLAGHA